MTQIEFSQTSAANERNGPTKKREVAMQRRRPRHAQLHLPPLRAEDALLVVNVLQKAMAAIWRAHGEAMADYLQVAYAGSMPRPPGAVWCGNSNASEHDLPDDDIPF